MIPFSLAFADADKIFKENNKAVVVIVALDMKGNPISQGSGFIVRPDGAIVTNYHVISNARDITIKAGDKVLETEGLLHIDKENDLVILKAEGKNLPTVKLGDISKIAVGEKVYVISSPQGLENTISDGILSGIREIDPERKILQITAPISAGSSGGPVFNKNGEVIGIATFLIKEAQNINFAMPINLIKDKILAKKVTALNDAEIEDYKKTAEYWFNLGFVYHVFYMYEDAIESYKFAIKINPYYPDAYNNLGFAYGELGLHREAINAYKQLIKIKPDHVEAHYNLGAAYVRLAMYREAIEALKQTVKVKPDFAEAYLSLGIVYSELKEFKEAIEAFKHALKIKPDDIKAYYGFGYVYNKLGMYREAIDALKKVIRKQKDYVEAYNEIGFAYGKLAMYKEAIEAFKQAIKTKPDYAEAHCNLGVAYAHIGKNREAIKAFKEALKIQPKYADAHYGLGVTYFILNDRNPALEEYKILKDLDPEKANKLFNLIYK